MSLVPKTENPKADDFCLALQISATFNRMNSDFSAHQVFLRFCFSYPVQTPALLRDTYTTWPLGAVLQQRAHWFLKEGLRFRLRPSMQILSKVPEAGIVSSRLYSCSTRDSSLNAVVDSVCRSENEEHAVICLGSPRRALSTRGHSHVPLEH